MPFKKGAYTVSLVSDKREYETFAITFFSKFFLFYPFPSFKSIDYYICIRVNNLFVNFQVVLI